MAGSLTKALLAVTAVIEVITGLTLLLDPALVVRLLLREDINGPGQALGRLTGIALIALGESCWPRPEATLPALGGMLVYNLLATGYLSYLRLQGKWVGRFLIPAIALHGVFTLLLTNAWIRSMNHQRRIS